MATQVLDSAGGTTDSTFDALNRLTYRKYTESGTVQLSVTQVYDADSRLTEEWRYGTSYSLVARTSFTYDAASRLTNLQHRDSSGNNLANYTYTYDAQSRLTTEVRNGTTVTYTYDNTDQLTADGTATFTYDANGNRNNGSYTTGTGNRMTSDGTWTYTYDNEGNEIKKSKGASAETWTYVYDEKNELVTVQHSATDGGAVDKQVDFKYDVFGNRIEKSYDDDGAGPHSAIVTRFAYDAWKNTNQHLIGNENWDVWADLNGSSSLTTRYIRGDVIDQVFARRDAGTTYWELTDRLGSVRDVIDNSAVVKDTIAYDGFGNITSETGSSFRGRYAWTGREIDTEINLQYNRARYYDANTGRWINQDPLGFDAGDANLYRYVGNNPPNATDPSGLDVYGIPWDGMWPPSPPKPSPPFPAAGAAQPGPINNVPGENWTWAGLIFDPHTKPEIVAHYPFDQAIAPTSVPRPTTIGVPGGQHQFFPATLAPGTLVGTGGCETCIAVIIHTPGHGTAVFHFTTGNNVAATLGQYTWPSGSHAMIAGGNNHPQSNQLMLNGVSALGSQGIHLDGVSGASSAYFGADGNWHYGVPRQERPIENERFQTPRDLLNFLNRDR